MADLMAVNAQWRDRPADQRFLSLTDLHKHAVRAKTGAVERTVSVGEIQAQLSNGGLTFKGPKGNAFPATHWAAGQLSQLAGAPASYLRTLPDALAAACFNHGLQVNGKDRTKLLLQATDSGAMISAATGPDYGRVWTADVVGSFIKRFGDGVTGDFRVPGIRGKALDAVTRENTTIYGSDRDCFFFLADEKNRIEVKERRGGEGGSLARGFYVWNSETGSKTIGVRKFLFDFVCANRIIWGAEGVQEVRIRHTSGAPDRWMAEIARFLHDYMQSSAAAEEAQIAAAQAKTLGDRQEVTDFLLARWSKNVTEEILSTHVKEEGREVATLWDVVTGATAYARTVPYQDERVKIEIEAGKVLALA